ncbi:MAG: DUF3189 family protein [Candidatus Fermentithermobacillus carboniphilus]|uniref:DUF3189 family protein n=1 Tax=Candidatus Fermentithermobacillus carboniphilus TaxID=3085328 RepID=A0AAT9LE78_9FIRM|nr:MAG: DUF3189 family protein [Candidatus Fermentithermobacillus carboniphilus]
MRELEKHYPQHGELVCGSRNRAAKADDAFLVWGVAPSPLAERAIRWMLSLYAAEDGPSRRVFYSCYAGTHTSVVASAVHLGLLDEEKDLSRLPYFDTRAMGEIGIPAFMGADPNGTEVYAMGTGWLFRELEAVLCDLVQVANPKAFLCICNVRGFLDLQAKIGGFLSRRFSLVLPGRRLIAASLRRKLPEIERAVAYCLDLSSKWKDNEKNARGEVVWIDGSKQGRPGCRGEAGEPGRIS